MDFCEMDPARLNHFHRAIGSEPDMILSSWWWVAIMRWRIERSIISQQPCQLGKPDSLSGVIGTPTGGFWPLGRTPHGAGGEG